MKDLPVDEVCEGDILARDLLNSAGSTILARGAKLSASMLTRLKKMGVQRLAIEEKAQTNSAEERDTQLALLEERFADTEPDPYLREMKRIVADRLRNP